MFLDWEKLDINKIKSKLVKEFLKCKKEDPTAVVFLQIGSFYETYFSDAEKLTKATNVTLTSKNIKEIGCFPSAGFPTHALKNYLRQMLEKNHKISVYDQFPTDVEDEYIRKLTRTYTKGTIVEQEFLESTENNYILAVGNKNNIYEISYADVSTGQFYKTQATLNEILTEIAKINPCEIIVSEKENDLIKYLEQEYYLNYLSEDFFTNKKIEETLLKYCKHTQKAYNTTLDKLINYDITSFLIMDEITRRNLELTRTKRFLKKKGSLLWFLNNTKTVMGTRLLKKYLNEPLLDVEKITERHNAINEIISKNMIIKLEETLQNFCDLSRICAHISNSTIKPKELFQIARNKKHLKEIYQICKMFNSSLLKIDNDKLNETLVFAQTIDDALKEDASDEITKGNIIKDGYNAHLDYLRQNLTDYENRIIEYEKEQQKKLDIKNLKIGISNLIGYYIELPSAKASKAPDEYIKKQGLLTCARFSTEKLKALEKECFNLKYQIAKLEHELFKKIREEAKKFIETIRILAKDIARVDVLNSYSRCAITNNFSKPDFNDNSITIKNGFHPSLLKLKNDMVSNDTTIKNGGMIILTGANMSGKSTYLKHNAIICLLSQIGSFVPADYANLTILDKIFVRQGSTDDIINNNSTFMVEMNDLKFILDNVTDSSLVLLDEPAKSTSAKEGGAIARAFCEYLLQNYKAKTIVATHNLELAKIKNFYEERVENYVIGNSDTSYNEIIDRKIKRGVINSSLAINTAILAELPNELITLAKTYM